MTARRQTSDVTYPLIVTPPGAEARGAAIGEAVPERIAHSLSTYRWLFAELAGLTWDDVVDRGRAWSQVLQAVRPAQYEELSGMATAAAAHGAKCGMRSVTIDDLVALNVRSEILSAAWSSPNECTAIVAPHASGAVLAQTWDWYGVQSDALVLVDFVTDSGDRRVVTLTEAGMLAKVGVNSDGLALGINFLSVQDGPAAPDASSERLPVHCTSRAVLEECATVTEAIAWLQATPPAGAVCMSLADSTGEVAQVELVPGAPLARVSAIDGASGISVHTNHCIDSVAAKAQGTLQAGALRETTDRYERASTMVANAGSLSGAQAAALLRGVISDTTDGYHGISQPPNPVLKASDRTETVCGLIVELGSDTDPELTVIAGRPDTNPPEQHVVVTAPLR